MLQYTVAASLILSLQACAVVAVADAAVTVVATGVKVSAKSVGAVADAVIPDGDDD
ncbi:MAG: NF038104 family lipoprotein [Rhodoferax sp.]|nr:NF038104 family lipoprotein [Rhodoferax sp.]